MRLMRIAVLIGTLLGAVVAAEAAAQGFPVRTVRYILPLPAGQETDVFARVLARRLVVWGKIVKASGARVD